MAKYPKVKPITLFQQLSAIKTKYTNVLDYKYKKNEISLIMKIKPTEESTEYTISISYKLKESPRVVLLSPELQKHEGRYPHHKYGFDKNGHPVLCLYYPKMKEWHKNLLIADTIIPWISTWLFAYEYWLITGKWNYDESNEMK